MRWLPCILAAAVMAPSLASAAADLREAIAAAAPAAASAQRGEALFRTAFGSGDARTPSCTSCHTADPRQPGRNAKTGRPMDPLAASVNPSRFTDADEVEKHFLRDCKSVLGRQCSAQEKADFMTFMIGQ